MIFFQFNIGDSLACYLVDNNCWIISEAHNLKNDKEKIWISTDFKGSIIDNRVGGILLLSRALGDFDLTTKGVISEPYIS